MFLDKKRISQIAKSLMDVVQLDDPIGIMEDVKMRPNGMQVGKRRVPLGVIGAIFEFKISINDLEWNQTVWSGIWITGVLATFVAILIMVWAQKIVSPIQTAMIFTLEPVFAGIYNHFFTDHILSSWGIFAGFIIVLGIIYHEYSVN